MSACAALGLWSAGVAHATALTLYADGAPAEDAEIAAGMGAQIVVAVGIDDVFDLLQYNVDILFDDTVLAVVDSAQLACLFDGNTCAPLAFTVDPFDPASADEGRRSATLTLPPDFLTIDTADTGAPIAAMFSVTFQVIDRLQVGELSEIQVGILNPQANEITDVAGLSLIPDLEAAGGAVVSVFVPEPSAALASGAAFTTLAGLIGWRRACSPLRSSP